MGFQSFTIDYTEQEQRRIIMANFCGSCGVRLDSDMRVCPNCGRLVRNVGAVPGRAVPASAPAARPVKRKAPRPQPRRAEVYEEDEEEEEEKRGGRAVFVLIKRLVVVGIVVAAIYFAAFGIQVLRVKHSTYKFDIPAEWLSAKNYGQAFENSTEEGKWHYNPFTFRVRYTGVHNGEEIEVVFSVMLSVDVKEVDVDGEEKTSDKDISNALMGLFI